MLSLDRRGEANGKAFENKEKVVPVRGVKLMEGRRKRERSRDMEGALGRGERRLPGAGTCFHLPWVYSACLTLAPLQFSNLFLGS